ncbi:hypothetical protein PR048_009941 [Dryococelus australis]|uniref:Uncharacterized protein n=1 Tax=Dryococelus australis TaxID=614101 RepID=A0ABQ9I1C0_9NEOP|nr:hypothetical protein PR048_009941 [Dryococelus australis]
MMKHAGLCLRCRTTLTEVLPKDCEEKLLKFQLYVIYLQKKNNYRLGQMGNADETYIYLDMPSNFNIMLVVTTDRQTSTIHDSKWKTMARETLPHGVIVRIQEKGSMTEEFMSD